MERFWQVGVETVFEHLTSEELAVASGRAAAAGLAVARRDAVQLMDGLDKRLGRAAAVVELLMARDSADERWERLAPFEQQWALLVVRIVDAVMDPAEAVSDARRRGCSWAALGSALGISAQSAHERLAMRVATDS